MLELDDTPTAQCGACHGTGIDQSHGYDCEQCQGDGWVYVLEPASKTHGGAQAMTHTSTEQPEALRLAGLLRIESDSEVGVVKYSTAKKAEQELRRLHARVQELKAERTARMTQNDRMAERIAELEAQVQHAAPVPQGWKLVQLSVLSDARDTAMQWCIKGRVPECGAFAQIAQDLDAMLAAAPQPPEAGCSVSNGETKAAPVQLPEPVAYQWLSTDNFRISGGPVSGAYWNKLYTEQQVRELLNAAEAGNGK